MAGLKKSFFLVLRIIAVIIFFEALAFCTLVILDLKNGQELKPAVNKRKTEVQDAWSSERTGFDPLFQTRYLPLDRYMGLTVNEHGFIANGPGAPVLKIYPDKPPDFFRIVALGGSSLAGAGSIFNSQTIPSCLEKELNSAKTGHTPIFQVLNFGVGGGHTGSELALFFNHLVYLEPDLVILFDGYNDVHNALVETGRQGIDHSLINWSDYSYGLFNYMNGMGKTKPVKFFTFTGQLIRKISGFFKKDTIKNLYEDYPFYRLSAHVKKKHPLFENITRNNLDAIASYCSNNNIKFISYLQPHALDKRKRLSVNETKRIKKWFADKEQFGEKFSPKKNILLFHNGYKGLNKVYENLEKKYQDNTNIHFISLRDIFIDDLDDMYVDTVHYTPAANKILAEKMARDIKTFYVPQLFSLETDKIK